MGQAFAMAVKSQLRQTLLAARIAMGIVKAPVVPAATQQFAIALSSQAAGYDALTMVSVNDVVVQGWIQSRSPHATG